MNDEKVDEKTDKKLVEHDLELEIPKSPLFDKLNPLIKFNFYCSSAKRRKKRARYK